jgi:hypothetical protein
MSAQPDTDRSLTANKPVTDPMAQAAATETNIDIPPLAHPAMTINPGVIQTTDEASDTNARPDLSSLTREQLEAKVKTLTDNLASANSEAEFFRQQWQDLRLRDEALGVDILTVDERKLSDDHVQAMAELYQTEMKRREALQLLDKLLSTTGQMLQTAPNYDPQVRAEYEVASRAAKEYLAGHSGAAIPIGTSLSDGQIADVDPQLNAVIINLGKQQGVKEGMPFFIYQDDQEVGTLRIVLARDLVSAGKVELRPNVTLKVGDRVVLNTVQ